jgi:phosphoglycerol transferase MdoB-like AlkP superfamily enzyme
MSDNGTPLETLFERAEDYGKTTIRLVKLHAIDKSADVASSLVSRIVVVMTVVLSILIINIGIALWIGTLLGEAFYGFLIIGLFYALAALLLHVFRHEWIKYPVSNSIIRQLMKEKKV